MAESRLKIHLTAQDDASRSLRSVEGALGTLRASALRVAGVLGIGGLGASLVAMTKASIDSASALVDTADKIGIGIEAYQRLAFAANQTGVETEAFDTALTKLGVNISKAASGTDSVAATFRALGVSIKDAQGNILPTEEVLRRLADAFQTKLPNAADRSRVAVELFGKSGAPMVNMLRDGSAGLVRMTGDAENLGVVLREDAARALENMGDQVEAAEKQMKTARDNFVVHVGPAIAETMTGLAEKAQQLGAVFQWAFGTPTVAELDEKLKELDERLAKSADWRQRPRGQDLQRQRAELAERLARDPASAFFTGERPPAKQPPPVFDPDADDRARKAQAAAKRDAEAFAKSMEQLAEQTASSTFALAGLVLDEFAAARTEASRMLSETMRQIEKTEAHAVDAAKGSAEKIRQAREAAQQAELAAVAKYEAEKTSIVKREADERGRIETERAKVLRDIQLDMLPGGSAGTRAREILEARAQFDERAKVLGNDPAAMAKNQEAHNARVKKIIDEAKEATLDWSKVMESATGAIIADFAGGISNAFTSFIDGTKSAGEAFQDFAADVLQSVQQIIIKMLVLAGINFVAGKFGFSIPTMASGGVVTQPTFLLAGEGGEPEAIVPLSKAQQMGFGGGQISVTTVVNVGAGGIATSQSRQQGGGPTGADLARLVSAKVVDVIRDQQRPGGLLAGTRG